MHTHTFVQQTHTHIDTPSGISKFPVTLLLCSGVFLSEVHDLVGRSRDASVETGKSRQGAEVYETSASDGSMKGRRKRKRSQGNQNIQRFWDRIWGRRPGTLISACVRKLRFPGLGKGSYFNCYHFDTKILNNRGAFGATLERLLIEVFVGLGESGGEGLQVQSRGNLIVYSLEDVQEGPRKLGIGVIESHKPTI